MTQGLGSFELPELGSIAITLPQVFVKGQEVGFSHFLSYEYHEHFLEPADSWSFTLAQDEAAVVDIEFMPPRTMVQIAIDGIVQSIGYIDDVRTKCDRSGGTILTIDGRGWLSSAVDCHVDPSFRYKPGSTLEQLLTQVFAPFGVKVYVIDNTANRNAITGRVYGNRITKKGKPLASYVNHEVKPYQSEGAFNFASRVAQRFGLWIWPSDDGQTVIVGTPDYDQEPRYQLIHKVPDGSQNNVIESDVCLSGRDQPSCIVAYATGGGGDFGHATYRSGVVNPVVGADCSAVFASYPSVKFVTPSLAASSVAKLTDPFPRPLFIVDPESRTQDQLDRFVLRELSLFMRKSLTAHYTIMGHRLNGQPIATDTIISVDDDRSNIHDNLWVIGRSFRKSPGSGTTSTIECIRNGSLVF